MANTFNGTNTNFVNQGVHYFVARIMNVRQQLTVRNELKALGGWNDAFNVYLVDSLEDLSDTLENITYNPDLIPQSTLEDQAADTTRTLNADYNDKALASDNLMMPVSSIRELVYQLDGSDINIPQMTPENCPNVTLRAFITGLDELLKQATRLDSRHQSNTVTKAESAMLRAYLSNLYTVTQRDGGEVNRTQIPNGTSPSQEKDTLGGA
jgi:hypothetical protein